MRYMGGLFFKGHDLNLSPGKSPLRSLAAVREVDEVHAHPAHPRACARARVRACARVGSANFANFRAAGTGPRNPRGMVNLVNFPSGEIQQSRPRAHAYACAGVEERT